MTLRTHYQSEVCHLQNQLRPAERTLGSHGRVRNESSRRVPIAPSLLRVLNQMERRQLGLWHLLWRHRHLGLDLVLLEIFKNIFNMFLLTRQKWMSSIPEKSQFPFGPCGQILHIQKFPDFDTVWIRFTNDIQQCGIKVFVHSQHLLE
jgi:hypothetical protein